MLDEEEGKEEETHTHLTCLNRSAYKRSFVAWKNATKSDTRTANRRLFRTLKLACR